MYIYICIYLEETSFETRANLFELHFLVSSFVVHVMSKRDEIVLVRKRHDSLGLVLCVSVCMFSCVSICACGSVCARVCMLGCVHLRLEQTESFFFSRVYQGNKCVHIHTHMHAHTPHTNTIHIYHTQSLHTHTDPLEILSFFRCTFVIPIYGVYTHTIYSISIYIKVRTHTHRLSPSLSTHSTSMYVPVRARARPHTLSLSPSLSHTHT